MKGYKNNEYYYSEGVVDDCEPGEFESPDLVMTDDDEYLLDDLDQEDFDNVILQGFSLE